MSRQQDNCNEDYRLHEPGQGNVHVNLSDDCDINAIMANLVPDAIQMDLTEERMLLCTPCNGRAQATNRCRECALNLCFSCIHGHRAGGGQSHTIIRLSPHNGHAQAVGNHHGRGLSSNVLNNVDTVGNPLLNAIASVSPGNAPAIGTHLINAVSVSTAISNALFTTSPIHTLDIPTEDAASALVPNINIPTSNGVTYPSRVTCHNHKNKDATLYCMSCKLSTCENCGLGHHKGHIVKFIEEYINMCRKEIRKLRTDINEGKIAMHSNQKRSLDSITELTKVKDICITEITAATAHAIHIFEEKCRSLIFSCEELCKAKIKGLEKHNMELQKYIYKLSELHIMLNNALDSNNGAEVIRVAESVGNEVEIMKRISLEPSEDTMMRFYCREGELALAVQKLGSIRGSASAEKCFLAGPRLHTGLRGKVNRIIVQLRDHLGQPLLAEHEQNNLTVTVFDSPNYETPVKVEMLPMKSAVKVTYLPKRAGLLTMNFKVRGKEILGSPVTIKIIEPRDYCLGFLDPLLVIGKDGGNEGEFCRPWGVCCDNRGSIIVADRSNNRIQVFSKSGEFNYSFGTHGTEPGKFDRPTGITWDSFFDRLIISDKDNHRIQIFSVTGRFINCFGERGSKNGQFSYPWDVAVNQEGDILVSDTRNHRIQLFSSEGHFITKFGSESNPSMWKVFDSPRGICYDHHDKVVVTDFNLHRVGFLTPDLHDNRWLGTMGDRGHYLGSELKFQRPQGIVSDEDGNLIIADSRNNRLTVFKQNGVFIHSFGTYGSEPGSFDRPSGIALHPEGGIVVVDFGNSRVQVF